MKNFNYNVTITNNGNEIIIKTNDVTYAIREYLRADEAGCEVCLCNGYTGEVLCHNGDEPYCTDEMALMVLGYMCAEQWGDEDEDEEVCDTCGGNVVDGICQYCGRCVECKVCDTCGGNVVDGICQYCGRCVECEDEGHTAEDVVLALIQAMGGLPS